MGKSDRMIDRDIRRPHSAYHYADVQRTVCVCTHVYMNGDCKHADRANVRHGDLYASSMYDLLTHTACSRLHVVGKGCPFTVFLHFYYRASSIYVCSSFKMCFFPLGAALRERQALAPIDRFFLNDLPFFL